MDALRLKAALLGDLNHDLRTPLNGVIGLTHALAATPLTPAQREMVELIRASGQVLEGLLEEMLQAARARSLEAGQTPDLIDRPRILVVDDEALNRAAVALMLEPFSADVVEAEDGEQAVSLFADMHFDLVIMDVEMPGMDGRSAVRAIRYLEREEVRRRTPIFMLTGKAGPDQERVSIGAGADLHIVKPVTEARLAAVVSTALATVQDRKAG